MTDPDQPIPEPQAPTPAPAPVGEEPTSGVMAPEVSRRVSAILDAVEAEAQTLREEARAEARQYLDYSRRRADELVAQRQRRIEDLSATLTANAEAVVSRLEDAAPVRDGFESLVRALGDASERLAAEAEVDAANYEPPSFAEASASAPPAPPADPGPAYAHSPVPGQPSADPPAPGEAPLPPQPPAPSVGAPAVPEGIEQPAAPSGAPHPTGRYRREEPVHRDAPAGAGMDQAKMTAIQMATEGSTRGQVRRHLQPALGGGDPGPILDEVFGHGTGEDARVPWAAARPS